jgi:hypothetical protein
LAIAGITRTSFALCQGAGIKGSEDPGARLFST